MRSRAGGTEAMVAVRACGSSRRIALSVSAGVSPWNARWPETIS